MNNKLTYKELEQEVKLLRDKCARLERNEKFETYFANSKAIMLQVDAASKQIRDANKTALDFYGYSHTDFLTKTIYDLQTLPADEVDARMSEAANSVSIYFEFRHRVASGEIKDVEVYASPFNFGDEVLMVLTIYDVTEKRKAENKLIESESRFKIVFENTPLSYQSLDINACIIDVNPAWLKTLGYQREEVIGRPFGDFMTPKSAAFIKDRFADFIKIGEIHDRQFEMVRKDGTHIFVSYTGKIGYDEFGGFSRTYCVFNDITEQKKEADALLVLAKQKALILNSAGEGIIGLNANGEHAFFNPSAIKMLGYTNEEFEHKDSHRLWHHNKSGDAAIDLDRCYIHDTLITGISHQISDEVFYRKDGSSFPVEYICSPIYKDKKVVGAVVTFSDITKRKQAEEALHRSEETFRLLNRLTSEILLLQDLDSIYKFITENLQKKYPNTAVMYVSIDESKQQSKLEVVTGLSDQRLKKIIAVTEYNPIGRIYPLNSIQNDCFRLGNFVEFNGTFSKLLASELSPIATTTIEKTIGLNKIYTIGVNKGKHLLGAIHFITFDKQKIADSSFIEVFVKQAALVVRRRQTAEALRESQKQFKAFFEKAADAIFIADSKTGIIVDANRTASQLLQKPIDQIIGLHQSELHPKKEQELSKDKFKRHSYEFRNGRTEPVESELLCADGSVIPVEILAAEITLKGKPFIMGTFRDISLRKKTELALRESEINFHSLFQKGPIGIAYHRMIYDEAGKPIDFLFLEANASYKELTGVNPLGKLVTEVFPGIEKDPAGWIPLFANVAKTGKEIRVQQHLQVNDRWYDCVAYRYKPDHFVATFMEITKQKKIEKDLIRAKEAAEESEKRLRTFMNSIPDIVCFKNGKGEWLLANDADLELFDLKNVDYLGKTDLELVNYTNKIYKKSFLNCIKGDEAAWQKKEITNAIEIIPTKKGVKKVYDVFKTPIFQEDGQRKAIAVIGRDITKLYETQENLIKEKERAEESDRLKSAFLANMSHEIRTPMNGILGFAGLLKEPDLSGDLQQKYIEIIEKGGERMLNIINDIVSISKIESGQMEVNIQDTDINEQLNYIYTFFEPEIKGKGMTFSFKNGVLSKDAKLRTDREKVYAILTNLVKNAIKYSEKGSIELGCTKKSNFIEFYVKDTGVGIPKNRVDAIFERFIQADVSDKKAYQGAGLGLSISKAYVEMLGGKIWVESKVDVGSTFYFTLPCQVKSEEKETVKDAALPAKEESKIKKLKTLIVEDDEASAVLLSIIVEEFSFDIIRAKTGTEAVEKCKMNPDIDVIFMDIQMPEMDGYEATKRIRTFNKEVIIIAQTAFSLTGDEDKAIQAGCNDYITKPIIKDKLCGLIHKYFDQ